MNVIGISEVQNRNLLIIDDMIDTGNTLIRSAESLKEAGAKDIYACATHPVLSDDALDRIEASAISRVVVTDTIPAPRKSKKLKVLSIAGLFAEAIQRIHRSESISSLFEF